MGMVPCCVFVKNRSPPPHFSPPSSFYSSRCFWIPFFLPGFTIKTIFPLIRVAHRLFFSPSLITVFPLLVACGRGTLTHFRPSPPCSFPAPFCLYSIMWRSALSPLLVDNFLGCARSFKIYKLWQSFLSPQDLETGPSPSFSPYNDDLHLFSFFRRQRSSFSPLLPGPTAAQ